MASLDDAPGLLFVNANPYAKLRPFDREARTLNVIIDTPKGSRNKYSWDEKLELFSLSGVLPAGAVFPYDFGFIPNTLGGDGDPLDVLVVMDEPAFVGCLVACCLLGVIEAKQTEKGKSSNHCGDSVPHVRKNWCGAGSRRARKIKCPANQRDGATVG